MPTAQPSLKTTLAIRALIVAVRKVDIRTAFTPTVSLDLEEALAPAEEKKPTLVDSLFSTVQPVVTLRGGTLGTTSVAPYGDAGKVVWRRNLTILGLVLTAGLAGTFAFGYVLGRSRR